MTKKMIKEAFEELEKILCDDLKKIGKCLGVCSECEVPITISKMHKLCDK